MPFYFPTIGQYAGLLDKVLCMSLLDRMTALKGSNGMEDWIRMFIKQPFEGVPEEKKQHHPTVGKYSEKQLVL